MAGHTRRTGLIYLALALAGMGGALWVAYMRRSGVAESAGTLLPALAGLYLAWEGFRADRAEAPQDQGLAKMADQLAVTVRSQWEEEARVRRLNDPYPLSVRWAPADPDLTEDWPRLRAMAAGWPGGASDGPQGWATVPGNLAGSGLEVADVLLRRIPTRRLVVLGVSRAQGRACCWCVSYWQWPSSGPRTARSRYFFRWPHGIQPQRTCTRGWPQS
ncbi:hypothetical protein [Streptomyces triculaminicus]|uniref:hypothetical protein n=1 Tax=Streptomyces triculaminicus TaxID=2816232 RepID=UPI001F5E7BAB|nr:hypothetical protein [Streptomyces triculaminicus]